MRYLNSRPLIDGQAARVSFHHPAALADGLAAGWLDVGLAPVFELLRQPVGAYAVVDDVAIASAGPVHSVFLAHRAPLRRLRQVWLDGASRSSAHLLQVLLAEFRGCVPRYLTLPGPAGPATVPGPGPDAPADDEETGWLLIGDQAIAFRAEHEPTGRYQFFDLGEEWSKETGLPFVFAAWLARPGTPELPAVAAHLRTWRAGGERRLDAIAAEVAAAGAYPPGFPAYYLKECIRYRLGPAEKRGLAEYGRLLAKHGLIGKNPAPVDWI